MTLYETFEELNKINKAEFKKKLYEENLRDEHQELQTAVKLLRPYKDEIVSA